MMKRWLYFLVTFIFLINGCAFILQTGRRSDVERIRLLEDELAALTGTKGVLEKRLSREIAGKQVSLAMEDRGLVITVLEEVLFDSGKATLRSENLSILDKIAQTVEEQVPQNDIGIEGHTDNEPIKYSKWKSNWELSAHRALSVLHYLEDAGVPSDKLTAVGYGEYRPVISNDTPQGRQRNRRVEIVILPTTAKHTKQGRQAGVEEEELK